MMKNKASDVDPHYSVVADNYELDYKTDLEDEVDKSLGFEGNMWVQHHENQKYY